MADIKLLNEITSPIDVENKIDKPKKTKEELQVIRVEALKKGRLTKAEHLKKMRDAKEDLRQIKLKDGKPTDYNKPDSIKSKLGKLDLILERLNNLEVKEGKKEPIKLTEPKETEKPKKIILEEDKPKEKEPEPKKEIVEDTIIKDEQFNKMLYPPNMNIKKAIPLSALPNNYRKHINSMKNIPRLHNKNPFQ